MPATRFAPAPAACVAAPPAGRPRGAAAPLRAVVAAAAADLLARRGPDGRWHGGCRGRLLESALAAHLLRETDAPPAVRGAVEGFCARALAAEEESATDGNAAVDPFDRLLSRFLAAAALRRPARDGDEARVVAALRTYRHASGARKRALFGALLTLLRPDADWDTPDCPPDPLAVSGGGGWLRPTLVAVRLLAGGRGPRADRADVAFLRDSQSPDGSWDQYVLGTVTILLVLRRLGLAPDVVARGLRFVLAQVRDDGGVPFISSVDTWLTCLASLTLADCGTSRGALAASVDYLCGAQLPCGGWGYAPGVRHADADDTAVAVTFLKQCATPATQLAADAGSAWLRDAQNADGGFNTYLRGARSEAEISAKAITALLAGRPGPRERAAAARAWRWLAAGQRADGGYRAEWVRSPAFPVLHVLRAARAVAARGLADPAPVVARAVAGLRAARPADAGPLTTAYAVAALATAGDGGGLLTDGVRLLVATGPDTAVPPDSLGPRPFVYDVPLLYAVYRLGALAAARDQLSIQSARYPSAVVTA
ncbi:prenyltransferase/squalene oxidase repeat-containing protein [Streptomyces litchfieldiae]|uniref:Terpene cyclase/mutase family protein n=1 Tax=Streptomyces litchfieldiae TaxID=3075543 RepID=A0ABU2MKB3_9ACTN|nr:prenyltransferase/squalene oxidase repeat-containing protein [Streptomyces sp. DSM 44938]MDT0341549.1 terpene cyclase/mutase family protein [Streptomyces sp. DSM 44938]